MRGQLRPEESVCEVGHIGLCGSTHRRVTVWFVLAQVALENNGAPVPQPVAYAMTLADPGMVAPFFGLGLS
jgi:hypothetical protein